LKAEILTIGDELLRGEIVDSNKARIAQRLLGLDIECHYQVSVRDDVADMRAAFELAVSRADIVLVSGGLGPTRDDLTTEVLASTFGRKLVLHEPSMQALRDFFARVGREMTDVNRKQAYFPEGADVLANPIGTAPGFMLRVGESLIFVMPGVPWELERMLDEQVLPRIEATFSGAAALSGVRRIVRARVLRTFGMGESTLEQELSDLARDGDVELGFRTTFPDNYLRPITRAETAEAADAKIEKLVAAIRERLGALVYSEELGHVDPRVPTVDAGMPAVVGRLLTEHGKTVATAESCTGGLIAERLTEVPGSSAYFLGGVVAYANAAKHALLGVPEAMLEEHGAVSEPVARAMAEGARARFGADFAVSTTGISGPDGGSDEKPVGLVHMALASAEGTHADHFVFAVDRSRHRMLTSQVALDWLRRKLIGAELVGPSLLRRQGGSSAPGARRSSSS